MVYIAAGLAALAVWLVVYGRMQARTIARLRIALAKAKKQREVSR